MSRCTGHCCRRFPIGDSTPEQWADPLWFGKAKDGQFIADMLISLGTDDTGKYHYTCRHFNVETGNCMAYESRPDMCRDYPYGNPCEHPDCTEGSKPDVPLSRFNLKSLGIRK